MVARRGVLHAGGAAAALIALPGLAQAPARKVLRVALVSAETGFDPVQLNSDLNSSNIISQIFESPLAYDYLARPPRLLPRTAEALPEVSADGRVFTLRIRPGIWFNDDPAFKGQRRELVAEDYVFSLKRFFDPQYNSGDLFNYSSLKILGLNELRERVLAGKAPFDYDTPVPGARAIDRYTLRFELGAPDPRFVYKLAECAGLGAVAREVVERYGKDVQAHPVGTGAFRLAQWRRGSRIVLERSPSFRGEVYAGTPADDPVAREIHASLAGRRLPLIDELVFEVVDEEQPRWLSFLGGRYGTLAVPGPYVARAVPHGRLAPYLAKQGIRLQTHPQADMVMSYFNMADPVVGGYTPDKVALRRAIALGFDGPTYIRSVFGGQALPAQSPVTPFTSGYDPDYKSEMGDHDPARARALLDLAGYVDRDGDGFRELPDGQPLVLRKASTDGQLGRRANEIWQRSMARIGLRMNFEVSNWPDLLRQTRAGSLMIWGYSWVLPSPDGAPMLGIAYGPNAAESNDARFDLPAFNTLFERQQSLPDGPEREALMREAKNLMVAYMPYKAHVHRIRHDLVHPWLKHYWRHPFMRDFWRYMDLGPGAPLVKD
jgi:ABC-type transport system substrate-binding protein